MLPRATYRLGSAPDRRWSLAKPSLRPAVFFLVSTGADTEYSNLWWQTVMMGAGIGLTVPPMTSALLATVDRKQSGVASGVLNTTRQLGSVIGVALFGSLIANHYQFVPGLHLALHLSAVALLIGAAAAFVG